MKRTLTAGLAALLMASTAVAAPVKVGMITTLSGGGAGLGIDVRDGFMLALKQAGDAGAEVEVITEDDQQKPDVAVQIADRMIQSDKVDILTGIIFSNVAMAVVPASVQQGKFYLSPNAGPSQLAGKGCNENYFNVAYQNDNQHEAAGAYANSSATRRPSSSRRTTRPARTRSTASSASTRARSPASFTPSSARPTSPPRSPRSRRRAPTASSSSCRAAWASPSSSSSPAPRPGCR